MRIVLYLCFFVTGSVFGQLSREKVPLASFFVAGAFEGVAETLKWHYWEFEGVHSGADEQYWNPSVSWVNKYKGGVSANGAKFPLSTTAFVWMTDGYHLMRFGKVSFLTVGLVLSPDLRGRKWYVYILKTFVYTLSYSAGFHLTYSLIYR